MFLCLSSRLEKYQSLILVILIIYTLMARFYRVWWN